MIISETLTGIYVNDNRFTAVVPFKWVLDHVYSGLELEDAISKQEKIDAGMAGIGSAVDPRTLSVAKARAKMQRPFQVLSTNKKVKQGSVIHEKTLKQTPKYTNARGPLKDYLVSNVGGTNGTNGVLPSFFLYWPELLKSREMSHGIRGMRVDWREYDFDGADRGAILDGESRVQAALFARQDARVSPTDYMQLCNQLVTIEVFHGISTEKAAQHFIDLNTKSVKVDTMTKANVDPRNRWVNVTKDICDDIGLSYATTGRQLTTNHVFLGHRILLTHATQIIKAMVIGPHRAVLASSDREESWENVDFAKLRKAGGEWLKAIIDHFGDTVFADQSLVIRSSPVRLALGALGEAFYTDNDDAKKAAMQALSDINWTVSPAWNGLGGVVKKDKNREYRLSGGSSKNFSPAKNAIMKPNTTNGQAIRR